MHTVSFGWLLVIYNQIISFTCANWVTGEKIKNLIFVVFDEIDFEGNLCWSMPCLNGGSCFGSAYTYLCVCPINYGGALCEKQLGI